MSIKQTKTNYSHVCVGVQRSTFNPQPSVHCWYSESYHRRPCACQRLWYSKGPRWSGLVVMVKVMFIDESSGCCHHASCAMALHRRGRCRAFNCCLTLILLHAHRRSPVAHLVRRFDDSLFCFKPCSMGAINFITNFDAFVFNLQA